MGLSLKVQETETATLKPEEMKKNDTFGYGTDVSPQKDTNVNTSD